MIEKVYNFAVDKIERLNLDEYPEDEFAVARLEFLSTAPNAHGLDIKESVLRENANTALGRFVVAKIFLNDTMGHENNQNIFGYVPKEQEIEFTQEGEYLRASCLVVISKVYAEEFCDILNRDGTKSVSVEMKVTTPEDDEHNVLSFRIFGITVLGQNINPSCPNSTINFVRFSEKDANKFYNKIHKTTDSQLHQFAENRRKQFMAENKTYKVDKSKEAISTKSWGEVDKTELRNKILEATNKSSLVKDVYMLVESGWEEAPSEHLKYPVMCFEGGTLVYNRDGLASALGYAKKENETAVVIKVEKIYKKLDLDTDKKEEDKKMAEIKFAAVNIGDMWGKLFDALHSKYPDGDWGSVYRIDGIYEEGNKKFAIIRHRDEDTRYRLDFSFTEEGITLSDEIIKVEVEIKETDEIRKFSEPDDADKYKKFEEDEGKDEDKSKDEGENSEEKDKEEGEKKAEMSSEEMMSKIASLQADIESRDNIIMEKDTELSDLRKFKADVEEKEKTMSVETVMADVKECLEVNDYTSLREEGMACKMSEIDAWTNKVKAVAFSAVKKPEKKNHSGVWEFSAPVKTQQTNKGLWD